MKITVEFDSLEEFEAFQAGEETNNVATATAAPRRRRGRPSAAEQAAAPGQAQPGNSGFGPPPGAPPATGFSVPTGGAAPVAGFPGAGSPAAPQANPLVQSIILKTEQAIQAGQPLEAVVGWYRQALGPETAQANWEQIKAAFLPRAAETILKQIAAQIGA